MITIQEQFAGPPDMGNGGYVCGLLAHHLPGAVEVTLRRPAPLEKPLMIKQENGRSQLLDGEALIGEAQAVELTLSVPEPPDYQTAVAASARYIVQNANHPFPHCFVCGPKRPAGDGLQIFPTAVAGRDLIATAWEPHATLAGENGEVSPQFLWAALDCPGGIIAVADRPRPIVLGRMTAQLDRVVYPGDRCVVTAWPIARSGRKHVVGTAIFTDDGAVVGFAQAIWIELKHDE